MECLPTDIQERFDVDISALDIGDAWHARDLKLPAGVALLLEPEETIIAIHAPKAEEVPPSEEVQAEPEVIGKKKEEGEEAAEGTEEKAK